MDVLKELEQRIATLELHREYDVKLNKEQTEKLDRACAEIREIYIGLRWLIKIGKFFAAVSAVILAWVGIKNGVTPNG